MTREERLILQAARLAAAEDGMTDPAPYALPPLDDIRARFGRFHRHVEKLRIALEKPFAHASARVLEQSNAAWDSSSNHKSDELVDLFSQIWAIGRTLQNGMSDEAIQRAYRKRLATEARAERRAEVRS